MLRFVLASCLVAAAAGQLIDPKDAKILKEQRFNAGDGRFGSAFAQEDGVVFREETGIDGERVGQYSYVGEDGKTYTVKYTAGKDGFRILDGAHIPTGANGLNSAPFNADIAAQAPAPVQQAVPATAAPRFVQPQQAQPAVQTFADYDYVDAPVDPNFNPFVNPHDPTHRNFQFNSNAAKFAPNNPIAGQIASVPPCADCAGVNPFINPFDASHQNGGLLAGHLAGAQQAPRRAPAAPQQPAFAPQQPAAAFTFTTTPAPRRFFPPGQLNLNRFETGFNFDFSSQ